MISIRTLFEDFRNAWSSQNKFKAITHKKRLSGLPGQPSVIGKGLRRIKKMGSKLSNINIQR